MSGEGSESRKDDEEEHDDLEDTEDVEKTDAPLGRDGVQEHGKSDTDDADAAGLVIVTGPAAGSVEYVATEGEGVSGREAEEQHLRGQDAGGQVSRTAVDAFEIILFAAGSGDGEAEFEVDAETGEGDDAA